MSTKADQSNFRQMSKPERFHDDFVLDLISHADHYDSISAVTGRQFRESVDKQIDFILDFPEAFPIIHRTVRAVRIRTFPFVILYEIRSTAILFLAIVHGASDRKNWFSRTAN